MKKKILFGSLLAVFLMLMIPNISALQYHTDYEVVNKKLNEIEIDNKLSYLPAFVDIPDWLSWIIGFIIGFVFSFVFSKIYFSRTVYVDDDAADEWYDYMHVKTIQEGVDHADRGYANNVRVYAGTYDGQIMMSSCHLTPGNMGHWLIGNGSGSTIIDAKGADYGINLSQIDGWSRIIGFTITNASDCGINIDNSQWNFITENTLINNEIGIKNDGGDYSPIWKNNFINNEINAYDTGENDWSFDCYGDIPINGNYWDDFTGEDEDDDGIGDTPYYITGGNSMDSYPLIQPWEE